MGIEHWRINRTWIAEHGISQEDLERVALSLLNVDTEASMVKAAQESAPTFPTTQRQWGYSAFLTQSVNDVPLFFKVYFFLHLRERLRFHLGLCRAVKGYDNIRRLHDMGVPSPAPVALLLKRNPCSALLITEALSEGKTLAQWLRDSLASITSSPTLGPSAESNNLLRQLAVFLNRIHKQGIYHRDLHDENIWLSRSEDGGFLFQLLDVEAVTFCRRLSMRRRIKNLRRIAQNLATAAAMRQLDGETLALEFANYYSDASGLPASPRFLEIMKAAARRGMKRWKPTNLPD
ncbi:MAG: hypothetical protein GTO55_04995 [Armatimonadetes bacterium]|nr:hypothetical protein [Armatimonadota bacterium]NIM23623.1 hypothetical protein [Armatimonadota bacterium]NIM67490.1 hypothetical protein [Armatimonadota bacterium]NIM75986.1 hypothetical protein [Armatimonadota bacterium]NIN05675.1 hypothetical protein [Armatimonadota bacterium]